ncbi:MAG: hypothetical protein KDH96_12685 [Candidatus Riesia sp.]|nr:hypothetical protein [Candidatus Riesia sp.]
MKFTFSISSDSNTFYLTNKELTVYYSGDHYEEVFKELKRIVLFFKMNYPDLLDDTNIHYIIKTLAYQFGDVSFTEWIRSIPGINEAVIKYSWLYASTTHGMINISRLNIYHIYNALKKDSTQDYEKEMLQFELFYRLWEQNNG